MSADFWSFATTMSSADAVALEKKLLALEMADPIVDPKGKVLHRFGGRPSKKIDIAAIGKACNGKAPEDIGRAYVDASLDDLEPLLEGDIAMSSPYAAIVVIDRAIALPHGIDLMGGHAVRAISFDRLMRVSDQLSGVTGGLRRKKVIATIAKHLERSGTGAEDATRVWEMFDEAIDATFRKDGSLVLVGAVAP